MNINYVNAPTPLDVLIERHRKQPNVIETAKLELLGAGNNDVYNIAQEFVWNGKRIIAGRIEPRDSELSRIGFFHHAQGDRYVLEGPQLEAMQDPCVEVVDGELIVGGTEIFPDEAGHITMWHTTFFRGFDLAGLNPFAVAPAKMKDVRLIKTDKIHVFSRPQGGIAGPGRIGYLSIESLDDLTPTAIAAAPLLTTQFEKGTWGGVNQIHALKNGLLGIVGHIARMSEGDVRHYYGMSFVFDPKTKRATEVEILCERSDFSPGETKRPDLVDVVFLGGMVRHHDGTATLYTGLSDAESHRAKIVDPFVKFEEASG